MTIFIYTFLFSACGLFVHVCVNVYVCFEEQQSQIINLVNVHVLTEN